MNKKLLVGLGVIGAAAVGVFVYLKRKRAALVQPVEPAQQGAITGGLKNQERVRAELNGEPRQPTPGGGMTTRFLNEPTTRKPSNNVDQVKAGAEGGREVQGTSLVFRPENLGGKKTSDYAFQPTGLTASRQPMSLDPSAGAPRKKAGKSSLSVDDPGVTGRELAIQGGRSTKAKGAASRALGVNVDPGYLRKPATKTETGAVKARRADGSSAYSRTITTDPGAIKAREGANRSEVKASELPKFNLGLADVYNSQARALENDEPPTTSNRWYL